MILKIRSILVLFFVLIVTNTCFSFTNEFSDQLKESLIKQNFSCRDRGPDLPVDCRGKFVWYPEPLNIYFSHEFTWNDLVLAIHFHGFNLYGDGEPARNLHFDEITGNGDYGKFLSQAKSNIFLVIPESLGKVDTYKNFFNSPDAFRNFVKQLEVKFSTKFKAFYFSGHSGADQILEILASECLQNIKSSGFCSKIHKVGLFDALYGDRVFLKKWIRSSVLNNNEFYFLSSFVLNGSTSLRNHKLMSEFVDLPEDQVEFLELESEHMAIMRKSQMGLHFWGRQGLNEHTFCRY